MKSENEFLLYATLLGILITLLYDGLRILRRVIPHNAFFVSLEDLGFWLYCGSEVFLLMYHENNGTLRWFAVLGALAGMLLYRKLLSPLLVKYITLLLQKLLQVICRVLGVLFRPLRVVSEKTGRGVGKLIHEGCHLLGRIRRNLKNRLTYFFKMLKIILRTK